MADGSGRFPATRVGGSSGKPRPWSKESREPPGGRPRRVSRLNLAGAGERGAFRAASRGGRPGAVRACGRDAGGAGCGRAAAGPSRAPEAGKRDRGYTGDSGASLRPPARRHGRVAPVGREDAGARAGRGRDAAGSPDAGRRSPAWRNGGTAAATADADAGGAVDGGANADAGLPATGPGDGALRTGATRGTAWTPGPRGGGPDASAGAGGSDGGGTAGRTRARRRTRRTQPSRSSRASDGDPVGHGRHGRRREEARVIPEERSPSRETPSRASAGPTRRARRGRRDLVLLPPATRSTRGSSTPTNHPHYNAWPVFEHEACSARAADSAERRVRLWADRYHDPNVDLAHVPDVPVRDRAGAVERTTLQGVSSTTLLRAAAEPAVAPETDRLLQRHHPDKVRPTARGRTLDDAGVPRDLRDQSSDPPAGTFHHPPRRRRPRNEDAHDRSSSSAALGDGCLFNPSTVFITARARAAPS